MLQPKAKWTIPKVDRALIGRLTAQLNISPMLARLLAVRGIAGAEDADLFLNGGAERFHDPFLLEGMTAAVRRIRSALEERQKIRIYGDYDADGVCATSLMSDLMRELDANFDYYIPHRQSEGYGLNKEAVDLAREQGVALIVTVDTGISAVEEIAYARECGIDVIVTDHHEPPAKLPEAEALINPKQPECAYPFKPLAGVGVAFKLAQALTGEIPFRFLEFAAIGTIADLMPLHGENRLIVKMGLERIRTSDRAGIRALLDVAGINQREVGAGHIAFSIAPRINAGGRLERADAAVVCLTTGNGQEAGRLASDLDRLNRERQALVEQITAEAVGLIGKLHASGLHGPDMEEKVLVVAGENWNVGVVGIVASKLVERYYRPAIVFSIDPQSGIAKGSARSIPGFDMYKALAECAEWLDHYGGHQAAAGMSLHCDKLASLHRALNDIADRDLDDEQLVPELTADMELELSDVSPGMIEELELLAPYGMGNPSPKFILNGLAVRDIRKLGKDGRHLKLSLSAAPGESHAVDALGFGKADLAPLISPLAVVDVFGELSINEWNGMRRAQIVLQDIRIREAQFFDWRGRAAQDATIKAWVETGPERGKTKGILVFRKRDVLWLQREIGPNDAGLAVWLVIEDGGLVPVNEAAGRAAASDVTDLMVYSLPPDLERLASVLPRFAEVERLYGVFRDTMPFLTKPAPTRDQCKKVYGLLLGAGATDARQFAAMAANAAGLGDDTVRFILAMFEDLQLVEIREGRLRLIPAENKKDLADAAVLQEKKHRDEVEQALIYSSSQELKLWMIGRLRSVETIHAMEESV